MTFLTICQEVHNRLGMQGTLTSVSASGYQDLIVDMVSDAWRDVQSYRDNYHFLRTSKTLTVSAGTQTYQTYTSGASNNILTSGENARFGHWDEFNFIYTNSSGDKTKLSPIHYDRWIGMKTSGSVATPTKFTINPANSNVVFENLSASASVELYYYKTPQVMTANTDEPECPAEHHQLIVWAGLKNAANYFGNNDAFQYAVLQYDKALGALMRSQVPHTRVVSIPLA